jgi:hypothetical protein
MPRIGREGRVFLTRRGRPLACTVGWIAASWLALGCGGEEFLVAEPEAGVTVPDAGLDGSPDQGDASVDGVAPDVTSPATPLLQCVFSKRFGDENDQFATAVTTDPTSGDIVVAGVAGGTFDFGGSAVTTSGDDDGWLARFTAQGAHRWSFAFGREGEQLPRSVAIDGAGRTAVGGTFTGFLEFGPTSPGYVNRLGGLDAFAATFAPNGDFDGAEIFSGSGDQTVNALAADPRRDLGFLVAGENTANMFAFGQSFESADRDVFVVRAAAGIPRMSLYAEAKPQHAAALIGKDDGSAIVAGEFEGAIDFRTPTVRIESRGGSDAYVVKLGGDGAVLWLRTFVGQGYQRAVALSESSDGSVTVAGEFAGTADLGGLVKTAVGAIDVFVAHLSPKGEVEWVETFGSPGIDSVGGLAELRSNGASSGFGLAVNAAGPLRRGERELGTPAGAVAIKLGASGVLESLRSFGGPTSRAAGLASTGTGDLIVVGSLSDGSDLGCGPSPAKGGRDVFLAAFR